MFVVVVVVVVIAVGAVVVVVVVVDTVYGWMPSSSCRLLLAVRVSRDCGG